MMPQHNFLNNIHLPQLGHHHIYHSFPTKGWQYSQGTMNRCQFQNHMRVGATLLGPLPLRSTQS